MKIFISVFMFLLIFASEYPVIANNINVDKNTAVYQIGFYKYQFSKINTLQGFDVHGVVYNGRPSLTISREKLKRDNSGKYKVEMKTILNVTTNPGLNEINNVKQILNNSKNITMKEIVYAGSENWDQKTVKKYNYLDENNVTRVSEWYDTASGFKVKTAIYDENENLISFEIYLNVVFDQEDNNSYLGLSPMRRDYDSLAKKYGYSKIDSIEDASQFCNFIIKDLNN